MARAGRIAFILTLFIIALVSGAYAAQVPVMRAAHHLLVSGLVVSGLIWLGRTGGLPRAALTVPALLAIGMWLVSAALAIDPRMSIEHAWGAISMACLLLVFIRLIERGRGLLLVETTLLMACVVAMFGLVHLGSWYFGWGIAPGTEVGWADAFPVAQLPIILPQVYMPLGVSTWLAAYCAPLIVLAFAWGWAGRGAARVACFVLASLLMVVLLATGSRGGLVALMVGAGVFIAFVAVRRWRDQVGRRVLIAIGGAIAVGAVALVLLIGRNPERLAGDVLRLNLWRGAVDMVAAHPLSGVGVGLFGLAYREVREPLGSHDQRLGTAHNAYLNTLAETGAIGGLVMLSGGAAIVLAGWRRWRMFDDALPGGRAARWRWTGAAAALIGFGAQSVVDTFVTPALMLLTITLLALATADPRADAPPGGWRKPVALLLAIGMTVYGAAMFYSDILYIDFRRAPGVAAVEAVSARDPYLTLYTLQAADLRARAGDPDADRLYADALDRAPTWDIGWINRAALAEARGNIPAALEYLDRARRIDRLNGASIHWARIAEANGTADDETIIAAYQIGIDGRYLPLSPFWMQTPLRRALIARYVAYWTENGTDRAYRLLREHDPDALPALVESVRARWSVDGSFFNAGDAWVIGEDALMRGDPALAVIAFDAAVRLNRRGGDYAASRARARIALDQADPLIDADLALAALLGTTHESVNAIRAGIARDDAERARLLANAVPPLIVDQNFEGVSFGGRVIGFVPVEAMSKPDLGISQVQPWVELEALYRASGDIRAAETVRALIAARLSHEKQP